MGIYIPRDDPNLLNSAFDDGRGDTFVKEGALDTLGCGISAPHTPEGRIYMRGSTWMPEFPTDPMRCKITALTFSGHARVPEDGFAYNGRSFVAGVADGVSEPYSKGNGPLRDRYPLDVLADHDYQQSIGQLSSNVFCEKVLQAEPDELPIAIVRRINEHLKAIHGFFRHYLVDTPSLGGVVGGIVKLTEQDLHTLQWGDVSIVIETNDGGLLTTRDQVYLHDFIQAWHRRTVLEDIGGNKKDFWDVWSPFLGGHRMERCNRLDVPGAYATCNGQPNFMTVISLKGNIDDFPRIYPLREVKRIVLSTDGARSAPKYDDIIDRCQSEYGIRDYYQMMGRIRDGSFPMEILDPGEMEFAREITRMLDKYARGEEGLYSYMRGVGNSNKDNHTEHLNEHAERTILVIDINRDQTTWTR